MRVYDSTASYMHTYVLLAGIIGRIGSRCRSPQSFPSLLVSTYHPADMNNFSKSLGRLLAGCRKPDVELCVFDILKKRKHEFIDYGSLPSNSLTPQFHVQYPCSWWGLWGHGLSDLRKDVEI